MTTIKKYRLPHRTALLISSIFIAMLTLFTIPKSHSDNYAPQQGDIIFQTSRSSQSQAIQQATDSVYSHMGIILIKNNKPYVFEASNKVKYTEIQNWIDRGVDGKYVIKRVKAPLTDEQKNKLFNTAQSYLNKPYDLTFEWSDSRQYCSELVWKIYSNAIGIQIGQLQKLKQFNLSSPAVKAKLTERYGASVPLNETVISPKAIFESPLLVTIKQN